MAHSGVVRTTADRSTAPGPVLVAVGALRVLLVGELRLDLESVGTEVVTLGLEQVGGEILRPVTVVEGQSGAESRSGETPDGGLCNDVSPASLGVGDGLEEELVEKQVLEVWVLAVRRGDVLQEDGTDDATTAPHKGNLWLVELPAVLLGSLSEMSVYLFLSPI